MEGQEHTLVIKGVDAVLEIVMNVFFKMYFFRFIFYINISKLYIKNINLIFFQVKNILNILSCPCVQIFFFRTSKFIKKNKRPNYRKLKVESKRTMSTPHYK